ncbi:glycosyl transferase family 2 [Candidatus Saganbacteria bacterium CG08_land_8_20_14_0_20_45_16]|uniref:Glycosyl transferase family 2 n=1 Tax=Candidatus Saganbacteria bacterium CG08_land_8_20_14_0_20_45_16 TaxID=2014293 RepID=A0A2H0Y1X0_UNCSA|nr:MAG: glycosyl transferase family 2 [Candidatus Saganbacteria bacterium CG08_land_8_20_14_0_20_45_16]
MKDLSIIIVNTNNKKLLKECLHSIYHRPQQLNLEIIVSDNASSDGSQTLIKTEFPEVKLIENDSNLGFIKASNLGLKIAHGRYIMLLNDDTLVKAGALNKLVQFMDQTPSAGACGPKLLNTNGTLQHQGGLLGKKFWRAKVPTSVDFVIGAALMVRKEVLSQVGLMDENLFFYNDDLDWCLSIRRAGWKIYFVPAAEIVHYGGYSSKRKFNPKLFIEGFRGGLYFCRKHYGELTFHLYRLALCLGLILCLPCQVFNPAKLYAYTDIIMITARGQIPRPVLK